MRYEEVEAVERLLMCDCGAEMNCRGVNPIEGTYLHICDACRKQITLRAHYPRVMCRKDPISNIPVDVETDAVRV